MNNIRIYTDEQLHEAKLALINERVDIISYTANIEQSSELNAAVEISKKISDINGDIDLAIAIDQIEYFQSLTKSEASDENLWSTINIEYFSQYTKNRWLSKSPSDKQILQRVFKDGKNMYNRNSIARLWWVVNRTKDNQLDDPYEYAKILLSRAQFEQSILESSLAKNENLLHNLMSAIVKFENKHETITSPQIIKIIKRLNLLGGTYVLDIMNSDYFYNEILHVLEVKDEEERQGNIFSNMFKSKNVFSSKS